MPRLYKTLIIKILIMELEQLKQQWDILHAKLDEQQIINKKLMENAVKGKAKSISNENWSGLILVIFTIPFVIIMQCNYKGLDSKVFYFALFLLSYSLLFSIYSTLFFDKVMKKRSILEREKGLLKFKRINNLSTFIAIVLAIIFMVWEIITMYNQFLQTNKLGIAIFGFVSAIAFGFWVTYKYYRKINELQQSISDLKEFEKE